MELFKDIVFDTIIVSMNDQIYSHDFIFGMMRRFPREYTNALY